MHQKVDMDFMINISKYLRKEIGELKGVNAGSFAAFVYTLEQIGSYKGENKPNLNSSPVSLEYSKI